MAYLYKRNKVQKRGCDKNKNKSVTLEKQARGKISLRSTKSRGGERLLLLHCRAKAGVKAAFLSRTLVMSCLFSCYAMCMEPRERPGE